jgi:putative transposase
MPRKNLIRSAQFPYHVTNRVNNREWFKLPLEQVWDIFARECFALTVISGARIHAFVLMSNHYHLLLSTPERDLGACMMEFGRSVTQSFNLVSGRSGHLFNGRYRWSLIGNPIYYAHALKYVYRNPVKAGIVSGVEEYAYSTLHGALGLSKLPFPIWEPGEGAGDELLPASLYDSLSWLNRPFRTEHQDAIRKALNRKEFTFPKSGPNRKAPYELELGLA